MLNLVMLFVTDVENVFKHLVTKLEGTIAKEELYLSQKKALAKELLDESEGHALAAVKATKLKDKLQALIS